MDLILKIDLNVKFKPIKRIEENIGGNLCDIDKTKIS